MRPVMFDNLLARLNPTREIMNTSRPDPTRPVSFTKAPDPTHGPDRDRWNNPVFFERIISISEEFVRVASYWHTLCVFSSLLVVCLLLLFLFFLLLLLFPDPSPLLVFCSCPFLHLCSFFCISSCFWFLIISSACSVF